MHGNNKTPAELDYAIESGVGHIVVDSFDEIERLRGRGQRVLLRVTPGHRARPRTRTSRPARSTRSSASGRRGAARGRGVRRRRARAARAARPHRLADLRRWSRSRSSAEVLARDGRLAAAQPRRRPRHRLHAPRTARRRSRSTWRRCCAHAPEGVTVLCEPGRSLVGNAGVTLYTVGHGQADPGRAHLRGGRRRHVRQPAADALRRPLRGRDRRPLRRRDELCTIAGMHCESGDVLVRDVQLDDPRPGDVLVIPATGAYGARDGEQLQRRAAARR